MSQESSVADVGVANVSPPLQWLDAMHSLVTLLLIGRFAPGPRVMVLFNWINQAVGLTDESLRWLRITGPDCTKKKKISSKYSTNRLKLYILLF